MKKTLLFRIGIILLLGLPTTAVHAGIRTVSSSGKIYVPLNQIAPHYSMQLSQPGVDRLRLKNKNHQFEFETDSRRCWINNTLLWLNEPTRKIGQQWVVKDDDVKHLIDPMLRPSAFLKNRGSQIVVLDPGHGGKDPGAISPRKVYEKLLVLDVAKRVRKLLKSRGLTVHLTRKGDRYLTLSERTKKAAKWNADLFVSLHADSASKSAEGAGTFILSLPNCHSTHGYGKGTPPSSTSPGNRFDAANVILGARIQQNLIHATSQKDRGVKRARFKVLREAPCPATLVEMAFISNPKEEALVIQASYRAKIARGIADGIAAYITDVRRAKR